jgi:hypothetical protein
MESADIVAGYKDSTSDRDQETRHRFGRFAPNRVNARQIIVAGDFLCAQVLFPVT